MLWTLLIGLALHGSDPTSAWPQELEDFQRGLHAKALGYLDIAQVQTMEPNSTIDPPTLGQLDGFREYRRILGAMMGPDSSSLVRLGLEGGWEGGGWTPDLYLAGPPNPGLFHAAWSAGLCGSLVESGLFGMAGLHHADAVAWSGPGGNRVSGPETDLWTVLRWHRAGLLAATDRGGLCTSRISLLSDPSPLPRDAPWFLHLSEASVGWERADWNRWNGNDEWAGSVRVPVLAQRVSARVEAGSDGFRLAQVSSDIDPQGEVGMDLSWSVRHGQDLAGIRMRIPFLTFSVNDPDDVDEFAVRGTLVWSMRLRMTWEDSQTWYAPGRRPAPPGAGS
jgi:hypothetical protein